MLVLMTSGTEVFNNETSEFFIVDQVRVELEHSLVSLSKWESKFQKPFLSSNDKTPEEILEYVKCMIVKPDDADLAIKSLSQENITEINNYIDSKESATTFSKQNDRKTGRSEIITSELIYYWMISFNIPFECETWHLNRLFSLIRICGIKNGKPQKMSKAEIAQRNRALNEQRKQELGTRG